MNNYINEKRIYQLINKVEKSIFNGEILSCKLEGRDVYAIHEALMTLQQLVKLGIIGFDDEGLVVRLVVQNADNKKSGVEEWPKLYQIF